jgi:hypothetical protein
MANTETTATTETPKAQLSEKTLARRENEKKLREKKVDYRAKGAVVRILAKDSPKKNGSKAREIWDIYKDGMTVEDILKAAENTKGGASYARACIIWDDRHGHISVVAGPEKK